MKLFGVIAIVMITATLTRADMKIVQKVDSDSMMGQPAKSMTMTVYIKGDKAKIEFAEGNRPARASIMDLKANKVYTINHGAKQVMVMSMDAMKKMAEMSAEMMCGASNKLSIIKTENQADINGFKCREYQMTGGGAMPLKTSCWMTEDVDTKEFEPFKTMLQGAFSMFSKEATSQVKGLMIRSKTSVTIKQQEIKSAIEVQSVTRDPLADSLFVIPEGYTSAPMPEMLPKMNKSADAPAP